MPCWNVDRYFLPRQRVEKKQVQPTMETTLNRADRQHGCGVCRRSLASCINRRAVGDVNLHHRRAASAMDWTLEQVASL